MRKVTDIVLAERPDGSKIIGAFGTKLMIQRPDGMIVNDSSGRPFVFESLAQAIAWLGRPNRSMSI